MFLPQERPTDKPKAANLFSIPTQHRLLPGNQAKQHTQSAIAMLQVGKSKPMFYAQLELHIDDL